MEKDKKINETIEYLDESEYYLNNLLNEAIHWDTVLTKPLSLNKNITLYRMGHIKDKYVYPFFKSVGNKLWKGDYVSWWAEQPDETMLHFAQQAKTLLPDIKEHSYSAAVPDDGRGYKRSVLYIEKDYYNDNIDIFKKIKFYRYTKTFKIKDLSRGQEYAVHEWTYNDIVTPDKIEDIDYNDCIKNGSVVIADEKTMTSAKNKYGTSKYIADLQKKPWLYYDYGCCSS
jgi:hypothetical protein